MEKKYKKGERFNGVVEFALCVANGEPYFSAEKGDKVLRTTENSQATSYYWNQPRSYMSFMRAVEVKEPRRVGLLLICIKNYKEDGVEYEKDVTIICGGNSYSKEKWKPVTIDEKGNIIEVVE